MLPSVKSSVVKLDKELTCAASCILCKTVLAVSAKTALNATFAILAVKAWNATLANNAKLAKSALVANCDVADDPTLPRPAAL